MANLLLLLLLLWPSMTMLSRCCCCLPSEAVWSLLCCGAFPPILGLVLDRFTRVAPLNTL